LIAVAGWFYLFYSNAARRLGGIESPPANTARVVLRRINGLFLLLLAGLMYIGFHAVHVDTEPRAFILIWFSVMLLLLLTLILGMIDLKLTWKLRRNRQRINDSNRDNNA